VPEGFPGLDLEDLAEPGMQRFDAWMDLIDRKVAAVQPSVRQGAQRCGGRGNRRRVGDGRRRRPGSRTRGCGRPSGRPCGRIRGAVLAGFRGRGFEELHKSDRLTYRWVGRGRPAWRNAALAARARLGRCLASRPLEEGGASRGPSHAVGVVRPAPSDRSDGARC
jgi:hypothetical protein